MIIDPEKYAHEYELDAKSMIDCGEESAPVSIVSMRLWLRAAHAVVELTGPTDSDGKTFGSDGNVSLWLHESDLALGNILLDRISNENTKLRELMADLIKWCDGPCGGCIDYESCDGMPLFKFWTTTKERARELGVEVPE